MQNDIYKELDAFGDKKFQELTRRMQSYVIWRLGKDSPIYRETGPLEFVFNVISKALDERRNYDPNKVSFENFLFGALKSDISSELNKAKRRKPKMPQEQIDDECYIIDLPFFETELGYDDTSIMRFDLEQQKKILLEKIGELNEIDSLVLDCWCDGIVKPREIADFLEIDIKEVYKAVKRLERKRTKLQENE